MELRNYIEKGIETEGTLTSLAVKLGQTREAMTAAKGQRRGLPILACVKLAKLIQAEPLMVIAASEIVTEKKEERLAEWKPYLSNNWRRGWDSNPR